MKIHVLKRISVRHPEISQGDVLSAFHSVLFDVQRADGTWMAVGLDKRGRNVELLYSVSDDGDVVIYHAFTPPTKKFLKEVAARREK